MGMGMGMGIGCGDRGLEVGVDRGQVTLGI